MEEKGKQPVEAFDISSINGLHQGEDIYVVGAGPQLNGLDDAQRCFLASRVTIGLNRTQYALPLSFFLSAYLSECLLAVKSGNCDTILHARPVYAAPLHRALVPLRRQRLGAHKTLPAAFDPACPTLLTLRNAAIMAAHLALILGGRRVFFVGVEQNNAFHFYQEAPAIRQRILADMESLERRGQWKNPDHAYATFESARAGLFADPEKLKTSAFYKDDHAPTFRRIFGMLAAHGVEVFSTTPDSVVARAGAAFRPL